VVLQENGKEFCGCDMSSLSHNIDLNSRNSIIDGLRGYSILLVILGHTGAAIGERSFLSIYTLAREGVMIFFVISGYLITQLLLKRIYGDPKESQPLLKFYLRRALRILPAFYFFHLSLLLLRYLGVINFEDAHFVKNLLFLSNFQF
jgi:peptidoglycan/LPS O-acetylase OafA/YrhL